MTQHRRTAHHRSAAQSTADERSFARAWSVALSEAGLERGAVRLGFLPQDLVLLADRSALQLLEHRDPTLLDLKAASTSFLCGLLVGVEISAQQAGQCERMRDALLAVSNEGVTRVIAARCDRRAVAATRREGVALIEREIYGQLAPVGRFALELRELFDIGLAIGLATYQPDRASPEHV